MFKNIIKNTDAHNKQFYEKTVEVKAFSSTKMCSVVSQKAKNYSC